MDDVYINGWEVGRVGMWEGKIQRNTGDTASQRKVGQEVREWEVWVPGVRMEGWEREVAARAAEQMEERGGRGRRWYRDNGYKMEESTRNVRKPCKRQGRGEAGGVSKGVLKHQDPQACQWRVDRYMGIMYTSCIG